MIVDRASRDRFASATAIAEWLGYTSAKPIRRIAAKHAVPPTGTVGFLMRGRFGARAVPVGVYSEEACLLIAALSETKRAAQVLWLFMRWATDEARLARARAKGPLPFTRAVLGIARDRLAEVAEELRPSDERDLIADVANRLLEDRALCKRAQQDPEAAEASLARIAHAPIVGDVPPDPVRSARARALGFKKRMGVK